MNSAILYAVVSAVGIGPLLYIFHVHMVRGEKPQAMLIGAACLLLFALLGASLGSL